MTDDDTIEIGETYLATDGTTALKVVGEQENHYRVKAMVRKTEIEEQRARGELISISEFSDELVQLRHSMVEAARNVGQAFSEVFGSIEENDDDE